MSGGNLVKFHSGAFDQGASRNGFPGSGRISGGICSVTASSPWELYPGVSYLLWFVLFTLGLSVLTLTTSATLAPV